MPFSTVRAISQIATDLAVRELAFVVTLNNAVHYSAVDACIYKTWAKSIDPAILRTAAFTALSDWSLLGAVWDASRGTRASRECREKGQTKASRVFLTNSSTVIGWRPPISAI